MEILELKRSVVSRLRKVKKEQDLTVSNIMDLLEKNGAYLSESTVKRVFMENVDPTSFKYTSTLAPLADALLDLYSDKSGIEDTAALKALIHDKNKMINILIAKNEEQKADYEKRIAHLTKQVEKLEEHMDFRERVIERKDEVIEKLLNRILKE